MPRARTSSLARTAGALLLLSVLSPACSAEMATTEQIPPACTGDSDCTGDLVCWEGNCVDPAPADVDLVIEVQPYDSEAGTYHPSQFIEVTGSSDAIPANLSLYPLPAVSGHVLAGEAGVTARVRLTPASTEFPETLRSSVTTSSDETGAYSLKVLPGDWTVSVIPAEDDASHLPPLYPDAVEVGLEDMTGVDVAYPEDLPVLVGTLRLANEDPVPHPIEVKAVDPDVGRRVSTVMETSSSDPAVDGPCAGVDGPGAFCLVLTPGVDDIELHLTPGEAASAAGYPTVDLGPWSMALLDADGDGRVDLDTDAATPPALPLLGNLVTYKATVEGVDSAGNSVPAAEVPVKFTAERDGASFESWGITNSAGEICTQTADDELVWGVHLRENDYQVTLTPPTGGEFESLVVPQVRVTYTGEGVQLGQVFVLDSKLPLLGRVVVSGTNAPLEGLVAEALPVSPLSGTDETYPLPRYGSTVTGTDGMLRLELDRGIYDLLLKGSSGGGVPWVWHENVSPGNEDDLLFIVVENPIVLSFVVRDSAGDPASGALVSVHEVVRPPLPEEPPLTRLVWETTTSASGGFDAYLVP